jgi:hypothetical protein
LKSIPVASLTRECLPVRHKSTDQRWPNLGRILRTQQSAGE